MGGVKHYLSCFIYLKSGVSYSANNKLMPFQIGFFESSSAPIIITTTSQSSRFFIACAVPLQQQLITNQSSIHSCKNNIDKSEVTIKNLMDKMKNKN